MTSSPALFQPLSVRGITFPNRIIVSPMCQYVAEIGHVGRWHRAHHGRFALGGVGGAIVEASAVTIDGRITPGCLGIWSDSHIAGLAEITAIYRDQGIPVGIQLAHAGRKAGAAVPWDGAQPFQINDPSWWPSVAPSRIALGPGWQVPRALEEAEISSLIDDFAAAAQRAVDAGFDFVEIHGAHGYLINSFVSPISNHRCDRWGGIAENRFRLPMEIANRLRRELPDGMPIFYRISAVDGVAGGVTIDDSVALARALKTVGVDVIDCSSGGVGGSSGVADRAPSPGYLVPYAAQVRREADIISMAVGLIMSPEMANQIVADGDADLVALGRELLADSNFAHRAAIMLGVDHPHRVLPRGFAFYLERRRFEPAKQA